MTKQEKDDILRGLAMILEGLVEVPAAPKPERCRMLTVREWRRGCQNTLYVCSYGAGRFRRCGQERGNGASCLSRTLRLSTIWRDWQMIFTIPPDFFCWTSAFCYDIMELRKRRLYSRRRLNG